LKNANNGNCHNDKTTKRPLGRKTKPMTNIIVKIENASNEVTLLIKDNANNLIEMCNEVYAPKLEDMGNDDYRDWLFENHKELAEFLYDTDGAKNKLKMSQTSKNILGGIKTIATRNNDFLAWCESDFGSGTTSLAKVTASINKYAKSLEPKTETQNTSDESESTETESTETESTETESTDNAKPPLEQIAQELLKKFTADECIKLSEMLYDMACENASDEAIEKVA